MDKQQKMSPASRYLKAATLGQRRAAFIAALLCVVLLAATIALFFAVELSLVNPTPATAAEAAYLRARESESEAVDLARTTGADINTFPAVVIARIQIAQSQLDLGQISAASRLIDSVISDNPENLRALILRANIYEQEQDFDRALSAYRRILDAASADEPEVQREALRGIGASLMAIGDNVQALDSLTRAAVISPSSITLHLVAGELALMLERWDSAAAHFYTVLRFEPTNEDALNRLSELERDHKETTAAALDAVVDGSAFANYGIP